MEQLGELLRNNQSFLMRRVLDYAKRYGYVMYTSTLEEAWAASIVGLTEALILAYQTLDQVPDVRVDHDYRNSPINVFGVREARLHRQRGIPLEMFLGLMKYYRKAYHDLITEKGRDEKLRNDYHLWVNRFFDQNEIAFCKEWTDQSCGNVLNELQAMNRELSNEKNKYVTIFESLPLPVMLLDAEDRCRNMNFAAQRLLLPAAFQPGYLYQAKQMSHVDEVLPWLRDRYYTFRDGGQQEAETEEVFDSFAEGKKILNIRFQRMLDVSGKFAGIVIMFSDFTERMKIEEKLRHMSYHDTLTGLYNRAFLDMDVKRMNTGMFDPVGVISCDIDCLKLVNDTLGHQAGDVLMSITGQLLKKSFRESDIIARVGGDEFLVFMPHTDAAAVEHACRRIQENILEHNAQNEAMPVSLSAGGVSGSVSDGVTLRSLVKQADDLMYAAKEENRRIYREMFRRRYETYGQAMFQ